MRIRKIVVGSSSLVVRQNLMLRIRFGVANDQRRTTNDGILHHREACILRQTCEHSALCYNHYLLQHFRGTPCIVIFSADWPTPCALFCAAPTALNSTPSSSSSRPKSSSANTLYR